MTDGLRQDHSNQDDQIRRRGTQRPCQRHGDWFTGALPAEPVVLCSQTANAS